MKRRAARRLRSHAAGEGPVRQAAEDVDHGACGIEREARGNRNRIRVAGVCQSASDRREIVACLEQELSIASGEEVAPPVAERTPRNPYKGLRAFRGDDAQDFFGGIRLQGAWASDEPKDAGRDQSINVRLRAVVGDVEKPLGLDANAMVHSVFRAFVLGPPSERPAQETQLDYGEHQCHDE